jgi:phage terminase large subunit-like protein
VVPEDPAKQKGRAAWAGPRRSCGSANVIMHVKDLLQERERRRKEDPLLNWEPTPAQRPFVEAVLGSESYDNWFFAANRSGKTDALAYSVAKIARFGLPGQAFFPTTGWVSSLDFANSRDVLQPKLFDNGVSLAGGHPPFIPDREISEWRVSDQILVLKNRSIIGFKSADSGRKKYQGAEKHYIAFDEEHPLDIVEEATIRVGGGYRLRTFAACTLLPPDGQAGGVTWSFDKIIKPWEAGTGYAKVFTSSIYQNPHILPEEIARLEAMYPAGSVQRRIRLNGELLPGVGGSRAYSGFESKIHIVKHPEPVAYRRPLCLFFDFNVNPMVCGIGQRDGKVFRVYEEIIMEEGNIPEVVETFRHKYPRHGAEIHIYGDATGNGRTAQTGVSDYTTILNHMKSYPAPVRLKIPERNPHIRDRVNAMNRAFRTEDGEVLLLVDGVKCPELIKDFEEVQLDANGKIKKTTDRKDPYTRRTHISDACGYWIAYEEPVIRTGEPERRIRHTGIKSPAYSFNRPEVV